MQPSRVLDEMGQLGLAATEFGPDGFLPAEPDTAARLLAEHGMKAVGGFVPVVLFDAEHDPLPEVDKALAHFTAAGAGTLVLAAASGLEGYDERPQLDDAQWKTLFANLDRIHSVAAERGVEATLHPHVGTMVETAPEVDRVLEGSGIGLCLDTGHLLVGGADPVAIATAVPERIRHTHLKDVDAGVADQVRTGRMTYTDGVRSGLYRPLGQGDVDIAAIVLGLQRADYQGWYVMEQDTILDAEPEAGEGPIADVRTGLEFLRSLA
jgi:inosose dehydratase